MDWIVSLTPGIASAPLDAIRRPPKGATLIELRLDLFPGLDLATTIASAPLPVVATLRSAAEGGRGPDDPELRRSGLRAAREAGAALIDFEHARDGHLISELGIPPEQIILSWHDPDATPARLAEVAAQMLDSPARWIKVVPTARSAADLCSVLELHRRFNTSRPGRRRLLTFAMESCGLASRYLAPLLGPPLAYAAWSDDAAAAPGQLTIERTSAVIGHLEGPPQRLYGVVGADVSASASPQLHAAAARGLGLPYLMVPVSVPEPGELPEIFAPAGDTCFDRVGLPARGWAVTTPYKSEAAAAATLRAPRVRRAGAANTLILNPGQVIAENTDADGVVGALTSLGIDPSGRAAVIQGTGGAARGAAVGLHLAGAEVFLRSRDDDRAEATARALGVSACAGGRIPGDAPILVNASPLGRDPDDPPPFDDEEVAAGTAVVDMVYGARESDLVGLCRRIATPVADGLDVLLHQGIAQFAAFAQTVPPREAMREAIRPGDRRENVKTLER